MKFTILALVCLTEFCHAGVLLLPEPSSSYSGYSARCGSAEFICTSDYFISFLKNRRTPQFDRLMDSVDLSSEKFRDEFRAKTINILNSEELDRMQLAMLIKLVQQTNEYKPTFIFNSVEHELQKILAVLESSARTGFQPGNKEYIYFFRELLPAKEIEKIRTTFLKIPLYILHFASVPYRSNSFDFRRIIRKPLLNGPCGESVLTYSINTAKYCMIAKSEESRNLILIKKEARY